VSRKRTTFRWLGCMSMGVIAVLGLSATPSGAASPNNVVPHADISPRLGTGDQQVGFVTGGRNALYVASWTNEGNATLTNTTVSITLPPGSAVLSADPDVCTTATPVHPSDPVGVSCPRVNLGSGDTITQQVYFRALAVAAETQYVITSSLQGDERASDINKQHTDTFPAPDRTLRVVPTAADSAGGCVQFGDAALATQSGLSATNPLITAASLTGPTGTFCAPVILTERHRSSPTEACGTGATCSTDIAVTDAPAGSAPIQLTFTFVANNRGLTWYKTGDGGGPAEAVADCPGATQLPTGLDACVNGRSKLGPMAVALGVLWRGGPDPSWAG
jgi:hypothetical protein